MFEMAMQRGSVAMPTDVFIYIQDTALLESALSLTCSLEIMGNTYSLGEIRTVVVSVTSRSRVLTMEGSA